jgi:phosphoglycolate phosphatase
LRQVIFELWEGVRMKNYEYLLFDLDGTITDSFESVANCFIHALKHFGITVKNISDLRPALGPPLKDSFINLYGLSDEEADLAVEKYRERYKIYNTIENKLYPGIEEVLSGLASNGYKLILATSKPEEYAIKILKYFNLDKYFYDICGASFNESRSEKEDVLKYLLSKNNIKDLSLAVMIGDRKYDLEAAEKLGIDAIGVLYGYGDEEELSGYKNVFLAPTPEMLYNYLV